ncbi:hypothetical protein DFH09DRAFT_1377041 [Mycena vulgaris]|nr:hypothetical protein DFH09DRAFT_1377041 [Mycena vulgaris]
MPREAAPAPGRSSPVGPCVMTASSSTTPSTRVRRPPAPHSQRPPLPTAPPSISRVLALIPALASPPIAFAHTPPVAVVYPAALAVGGYHSLSRPFLLFYLFWATARIDYISVHA